MVEDLDEEKFVVQFSKATIKNWKGLKLKYLEDILLVDISSQDPEDELGYDSEQAEVLVSNSTEFDNWINEVVFDLANFRRVGDGDSMGETGELAAS